MGFRVDLRPPILLPLLGEAAVGNKFLDAVPDALPPADRGFPVLDGLGIFYKDDPAVPELRDPLTNDSRRFKVWRNDDREVLQVFSDFEDRLRASPVLGANPEVGEGLEHRRRVVGVGARGVGRFRKVYGVAEVVPGIWPVENDKVR